MNEEAVVSGFNPKLSLEKGLTILEWNFMNTGKNINQAFKIQRQYAGCSWETIGQIKLKKSGVAYKFVDNSEYSSFQKFEAVIVSYRIILVKADGQTIFSNIVNFDVWWKKYFAFIENEDPYNQSDIQELIRFLDKIIYYLFTRKFSASIKKNGIDDEYERMEVRQDLLSKLLQLKYKPAHYFSNLGAFFYSIANNWIITNLLKKDRQGLPLSKAGNIISDSPEQSYLENERRVLMQQYFKKFFTTYLQELWLVNPVYAFAVECWVKRKKEYYELTHSNIIDKLQNSEFFHDPFSLNTKPFEDLFEPENKLHLYDNIISDFLDFYRNKDLFNSRLIPLDFHRRFKLINAIKELKIGDNRSRQRIKAWIFRGLSVLKIKMEPELKEIL